MSFKPDFYFFFYFSDQLIGIFINNFSKLQAYSLSLVPTSVGGRGFAAQPARRGAGVGELLPAGSGRALATAQLCFQG